MSEVGERELLAIIFTDAVGSSSQTAQDEDKSLSMLMADLDFIRNEAGVRGGAVLKNTGDGLLISFKSAVDAVECALAIQKSFQSRPKGNGFQHKIGVHIGDVIKKDGDIYGAGVNTASRLVDQCGPGGICLSSTLFELTKQKSEIGNLKLQNFLLQNTEPPTLAYKSIETAVVDIKKTAHQPEKQQKRIMVYAGIFTSALIIGVLLFSLWGAPLLDSIFNSTQKYGYKFTSNPIVVPKSKPSSMPIQFSLLNKTGLGLELRWIKPEGKVKNSDLRSMELKKLSPQGHFGPGTTYAGHVFEVWDVIEDKKLGYLSFLCGTNLILEVRKTSAGIAITPQDLEEAKKGNPKAQARLANAFYTGEGVPRDFNEALNWAKKSANQNCPEGLQILARMREEGKGVPKDIELASVLRERAEAMPRTDSGTLPMDAAVEKRLQDLRDKNQNELADRLLQKIKKAWEACQKYPGSHVIVGQLKLADGKKDVRLANAQMEILEEGQFAGEVRDLRSPVGFALQGYTPNQIRMEGKNDKIVDVGEVILHPLLAADSASIKLMILGAEQAKSYTRLELFLEPGSINTPHNGTSPRLSPGWEPPLEFKPDELNKIQASNLSPGSYYLKITAPDVLDYEKRIVLSPGQILDMGTINLIRKQNPQSLTKPQQNP